VEKKVDGYSTRYLYACGEPVESNGPHVIAEYDGNNNLLRKYIYGPGIDQPVCMIEVADANAVYYYHFDALGSVVALRPRRACRIHFPHAGYVFMMSPVDNKQAEQKIE
jgi:hypothetical protein